MHGLKAEVKLTILTLDFYSYLSFIPTVRTCIIKQCAFPFIIASTCKDSKMAIDYSGDINYAISGRMCEPWSKIPSYKRPKLWKFGIINMLSSDVRCKNPDGDARGPWCVTDIDSMTVEYCDIPYCGKYRVQQF